MKTKLEKAIDLCNELRLSPAQRCLLFVLIVLAGDKTSVATSFAEIAAAYGSDPRNVQRGIKNLAAHTHVLTIEKSKGENGRPQPNRYSFPFLAGKEPKIAPLKAQNDPLEAL